MVILHIKRGDEDQFLFEANVSTEIEKVTQEICAIYNGRLKIHRLCFEIEELANHGTALPPEMLGLTDEQVQELKLTDIWAEKCIPSGGFIENKDDSGFRNGHQPISNMQEVLKKAVQDAKEMIGKKQISIKKCVTLKDIVEAMNLLKGATMIVYPMGLPPHDPIRMEFTNTEDLSGTQASKEVIESAQGQLWFAGHQMLNNKLLMDYVGSNDKSKVIIKLTKNTEGPPGREPVMTEDMKKRLMADTFRRQEQFKVGEIVYLINFLIEMNKILCQ